MKQHMNDKEKDAYIEILEKEVVLGARGAMMYVFRLSNEEAIAEAEILLERLKKHAIKKASND